MRLGVLMICVHSETSVDISSLCSYTAMTFKNVVSCKL